MVATGAQAIPASSGLELFAQRERAHIVAQWAKKRAGLIAKGDVTEEQCKIGERLAQMIPCHYVRWNGTPVAPGECASESMSDLPTVPDLLITTLGPQIRIQLSKRGPASHAHIDELAQALTIRANQELGVMIGKAIQKHAKSFTFEPKFADDGAAVFCGEGELKLSLNASAKNVSEQLPVPELQERIKRG